jgi:hypothetical protein
VGEAALHDAGASVVLATLHDLVLPA